MAGPPMNLAQKGRPLGAFIQTTAFGAFLGAAAGFATGFVVRMALELVIRPFKPASGSAGFLPAVLLGGLGGLFIGGPILGAGAALVLFVVWMARNRS